MAKRRAGRRATSARSPVTKGRQRTRWGATKARFTWRAAAAVEVFDHGSRLVGSVGPARRPVRLDQWSKTRWTNRTNGPVVEEPIGPAVEDSLGPWSTWRLTARSKWAGRGHVNRKQSQHQYYSGINTRTEITLIRFIFGGRHGQAGETSGFIADEARRAVLAAIDHCSPQRTTAALVHANLTRNGCDIERNAI